MMNDKMWCFVWLGVGGLVLLMMLAGGLAWADTSPRAEAVVKVTVPMVALQQWLDDPRNTPRLIKLLEAVARKDVRPGRMIPRLERMVHPLAMDLTLGERGRAYRSALRQLREGGLGPGDALWDSLKSLADNVGAAASIYDATTRPAGGVGEGELP